MPRTSRVDIGGEIYHVINRANARLPIFFEQNDYEVFEHILRDAKNRCNMRILAYCLMPNHFHLVLHPRENGDLQKFMQWITLTHTQRWHLKNRTVGTGHLYQGRYKSFMIEGDRHLLTVIRYVERNALRANLVTCAECWKFSSASNRILNQKQDLLDEWPVAYPKDYASFINKPLTIAEMENVRYSTSKGMPYGSEGWSTKMIKKYSLMGTTRSSGRPKKNGT